MTNEYLLPIGSGDLKQFRKNLEATRKGKKTLNLRMRATLGNFIEITFEDTGKPKNFKPDDLGM